MTGGAGLIGAALCHRLARDGDEVTVLVRRETNRWRLADIADRVALVERNLSDFGEMSALIAQVEPDVVFHLACSIFNPPVLTAVDHLDVNVRSTLCLLEALKDRLACRFIYTASAAEYPPGNALTEGLSPGPVNVYGAMKACASLLTDAYARIYGLRTARAVLFTVFGPGEASHRLVPSTILAALRGSNVQIKDGSVQRDMLFVEDVVEGLTRLAAVELKPGTVVNLSSGTGLPVRLIAQEILRLMAAPVRIEEKPDETRPDEIRIVSGDNRRARELLHWQPQWSLEAGLQASISWCRAQAKAMG